MVSCSPSLRITGRGWSLPIWFLFTPLHPSTPQPLIPPCLLTRMQIIMSLLEPEPLLTHLVSDHLPAPPAPRRKTGLIITMLRKSRWTVGQCQKPRNPPSPISATTAPKQTRAVNPKWSRTLSPKQTSAVSVSPKQIRAVSPKSTSASQWIKVIDLSPKKTHVSQLTSVASPEKAGVLDPYKMDVLSHRQHLLQRRS